MKRILLSTLAVLTLSSISVNASEVTPTYAKASKLKFSGVHFLGATYKDKDKDKTANFEVRRNYLQVKAYLLDDPKSYFRVTLDTSYDAKHDGYAEVYAKYMYVYLNNILPNTSAEIGMAHRPWTDYETHQSWLMRSVATVLVEESEAGHLTTSAGLGIDLKTKTPFFTSEVGLYNGEGYHGKNSKDTKMGDGLSVDWRFTAATMGNGKIKRKTTKDIYADVSFFGQYNMKNAQNSGKNYAVYGLHAVYNMPIFLVSAQYIQAKNDKKNTTDFNGYGYSANATYRFGTKKEFSLFGRFDKWTNEDTTTASKDDETNIIYGAAWQQNHNLKWLASTQIYDTKNNAKDYTSASILAEIKW